MTDNNSKLEELRKAHGNFIPVVEVPCPRCGMEQNVVKPCYYSQSGFVLEVCPICLDTQVRALKNWPNRP